MIFTLTQGFSELSVHQNHSDGLLNTGCWAHTYFQFNPSGAELRVGSLNKLSGDADVGPGTTL